MGRTQGSCSQAGHCAARPSWQPQGAARGATGAWAGSQGAQTGRPQAQLATQPGRGRLGSSRALASVSSHAGLPCVHLRQPQSPPRRSRAGPDLGPSGSARLPSRRRRLLLSLPWRRGRALGLAPKRKSERPGAEPDGPSAQAPRAVAAAPRESAPPAPGLLQARPDPSPRLRHSGLPTAAPRCPRPGCEGAGKKEGALGRASAGAKR